VEWYWQGKTDVIGERPATCPPRIWHNPTWYRNVCPPRLDGDCPPDPLHGHRVQKMLCFNWRSRSYRAVNTIRLAYRNQWVNVEHAKTGHGQHSTPAYRFYPNATFFAASLTLDNTILSSNPRKPSSQSNAPHIGLLQHAHGPHFTHIEDFKSDGKIVRVLQSQSQIKVSVIEPSDAVKRRNV